MKNNTQLAIATLAVATLGAVSFLIAPASAKDQAEKHAKQAATTSAAAAAALLGSVPEQAPAPKPGHSDSKPGGAWKTIGGTVKDIQGGDLYRGRLRREPDEASCRAGHETPTRA